MIKSSATMRFTLVIGVALAIAACQQSQAPTPAESESEAAGPQAKPGLSASDGVLLLPAVAGRPGAAYFTLVNNGERAVEMAAVHVEGAMRAELHETVGGKMSKLERIPLPVGETVTFERGAKHVMAFELDEGLKAGTTTELTLTFADGDKLSMPLKIEATGGMGKMNHDDGH